MQPEDPGKRPQLLPQPQQVTWGDGHLALASPVAVVVDPGSQGRDLTGPNWIVAALRALGVEASIRQDGRAGIRIHLDAASDLPEEGYRLTVDAASAHVVASTQRGAFCGAMTLLQLIQRTAPVPSIPAVTIDDRPDMQVRAMHFSLNAPHAPPDVAPMHRPVRPLEAERDPAEPGNGAPLPAPSRTVPRHRARARGDEETHRLCRRALHRDHPADPVAGPLPLLALQRWTTSGPGRECCQPQRLLPVQPQGIRVDVRIV